MSAARFGLFVALAVCFPMLSSAQESCPWLTTSTAAGILGGDVATAVIHSKANADEATCTFIRSENAVMRELSIQVRGVADLGKALSRCRSKTPLRGIGNKAFACEAKRKGKSFGEEIVGRVRDRAFIIKATASDTSIAPEGLREAARRAAEQVSGNLF